MRKFVIPAIVFAMALSLLVFACSQPAAPPEKAAEQPQKKLEKVMIGSSPALSSSGIFIAIERGYFAEEGIDADATTFSSATAQLLPSLVKGDLAVGGGNISPGLFNAFNDGHGLRIVADKGFVGKDCGYLALVAAPKHVPDGDPSKFVLKKGFTMGVTARGVTQEIVTELWLRKFGLTLDDIKLVTMPYSAFIPALANGSLDATVEIEPFVAKAVAEGAAVRIGGDETVYFNPYQQSAAIFFSEKFIQEKPDLAQRWMNAYLRGLRDYNDAFFYNKDFDAIVAILTKWTKVKDASLYRKMVPVGLSPDGSLNIDSLRQDAQWMHDHGFVKQPVKIEEIVDTTFIENAVKKLGPYTPPVQPAPAADAAAEAAPAQ